MAYQDGVCEKFLLIPDYFKVKSHFQESKKERTTHKLSFSSAEQVITNLVNSITNQTFSYGVKTQWKKFTARDSLPQQTNVVYHYKFFSTITHERIEEIYCKVRSLFEKDSEINLEEEDEIQKAETDPNSENDDSDDDFIIIT